MRIGDAVRIQQPIVTVIEVSGAEVIEIAVISINHLVIFTGPARGLVYQVPNESSLEFGIFTNEIPIYLEVSQSIAHGMCVLTHNHWFLFTVVFIITDTFGVNRIHRTINIRSGTRIISLLKVYETAWIFRLYPLVASLKV